MRPKQEIIKQKLMMYVFYKKLLEYTVYTGCLTSRICALRGHVIYIQGSMLVARHLIYMMEKLEYVLERTPAKMSF